MHIISATELKNRLGRYLRIVEAEPIFIEKSEASKAVLISQAMYERLIALEKSLVPNTKLVE